MCSTVLTLPEPERGDLTIAGPDMSGTLTSEWRRSTLGLSSAPNLPGIGQQHCQLRPKLQFEAGQLTWGRRMGRLINLIPGGRLRWRDATLIFPAELSTRKESNLDQQQLSGRHGAVVHEQWSSTLGSMGHHSGSNLPTSTMISLSGGVV